MDVPTTKLFEIIGRQTVESYMLGELVAAAKAAKEAPKPTEEKDQLDGKS